MNNANIKLKLSDVLFMLAMLFVMGIPGSASVKAIAIIAFFAYMMLMKLAYYRFIKNDLHIIGLFLFLGYAYMSKDWAQYPEAVDEKISNVLWATMLGASVSTYIVLNNYSVKDLLKLLMPIALVFLVNVLLNGEFVNNRLTVSAVGDDKNVNQNGFASLAVAMFSLMCYQCKQERWKKRYMNVLAIVFILLVFLSGSRTNMIIAAIYIIAFLAFEHPTTNTVKILGRLLAGAIICIIGYYCVMKIDFLYSSIGRRVESMLGLIMGTSGGDGSAVTRIGMMETAEQLFLANPLRGIGMNNFKYATRYHTYAHNNYYELAACLGVIGLLFYYGPLVTYLRKAFLRWNRDEDGMIFPLTILGAMLVEHIGNVAYFDLISSVWIGIAVGMLCRKSYK